MVKTAREDASKDHEIIQRRNDQLKSQLADMETLLKSHQEQLAELKQVMEQMGSEQDDQTNLTAPSTPGLSKFDSKDEVGDATLDGVHSTSSTNDVSPSYPTSFTHLLHPVLRADLAAYDDFISLLRMSKKSGAGSRASSGSYGSLGISFGLGASAQSSNAAHQVPSNGSTSSLNTSTTTGSSPATPLTPASNASNGSSNAPSAMTPLKETRFYKRALAEDIEPTLRLDTAPGLSWLARRSVLSAMCEGTLVVEPMPQTSTQKIYIFACSLCGETRKDPAHTRTHRFRTSETDSAQRYPLCKYCLGRVRSSCDFLGFLRMLKDGHWRTDDEESERAAWEESVRLREQMFWCRMGGGVVPVGSINHAGHENDSRCPRAIDNERKEGLDTIERTSGELGGTGDTGPGDAVLSNTANGNEANEKCIARREEEKIKHGEGSADGLLEMEEAGALPSNSDFPDRHPKKERGTQEKSGRPSAPLLDIAPESYEKSLSITIP
jgi:Rab guanine nucleotide exchange factor SEC2